MGKLENLFLLQRLGMRVAPFVIIDEEAVKNIDVTTKEAASFFKERNVTSIIIRSALPCEDSTERTYAGFFESSGKIPLDNLSPQLLLGYWQKNQKKAEEKSIVGGAHLFIQEFTNTDYSGVLFTQGIYDSDEAILMLSYLPHAITEGRRAEKRIIYDKLSGQWNDNGFLSPGLKNELKEKILLFDKEFTDGADVELGFIRDEVWIFQARPILRNNDEKILLSEKKRLKNIFKDAFKKQVWVKSPFVQATGDLSPASLGFYNYLFCSRELQRLLSEAGITHQLKNCPCQYRIFENIGNRTYCNISEEKKLFPSYQKKWGAFLMTIRLLVFERLMAKKSSGQNSQNITSVETVFAWLFLSGVYLQFFLEQEKQRYSGEEFTKRLKNTEMLCQAIEPRPKTLARENLEQFIKSYYFWADYLYELACPRFAELNPDEVKQKYAYLKNESAQKENSRAELRFLLGKKVDFWLKEKVYWKQVFLKLLFQQRRAIIKQYEPEEQVLSQKLSFIFSRISGENFPDAENKQSKEFVIVPGEIELENTIFLNKEDDIKQYLSRYIAVSVFPAGWIPFIPKIKGIILEEGNEFSHPAITCREFNIPCRVMPSFFKH